MPNALDHLAALLNAIAPDGAFAEEEAADVQRICDSANALIEGRRPETAMPQWVRLANGKLRLDLNGTKTPEEEAAGAANRADMAAAGRGSMAPTWDSSSVCHTTGMNPAQAEYLFPTKARFDQWCKLNGKQEIGKSDLTGRKPSAPSAVERQEVLADRVTQILAHMKATGQVNDKGELVPGAPIIPPPEPERSRQADGSGITTPRVRIDPDLAPADDEDGHPDAENIPLEERAHESAASIGDMGTVGMIGLRGSPGVEKAGVGNVNGLGVRFKNR